jgi:phage protein D
LEPQVNVNSSARAVVTQVNQSDLAFVRARAFACDADLWLEGKTLHVAARASRTDSQLELVHGARLQRFDVCADLAHQRTAVVCGGWIVASKEAIAPEAGADAIAREAGGGTSGPDTLQQTIGERKDTLAHQVPFDESGARSLAEAHLRGLARRFLHGRGVADADARIAAGRRVTLNGLGPLFSGKYDVIEVCHRFDLAHGLRTEFAVERAWIGRP